MRAFVFLLFLLCGSASATIRNSDGSASDTQAKINACANGDTVLLPSSGGPFNWTTAVNIPNTVWITLDGNGRTINLTNTFSVDPHATGNTTVTGFTWTPTSGGHLTFNDIRTSAAYVFHTCTLVPDNTTLNPDIHIQAKGAGLWYNITISNIGGSKEFLHIDGWDAGPTTGWTTDSGSTLAGAAFLTYIEQCTFSGNTGDANTSWIQGYYGCRVVIRNNAFTDVSVDMHGTPGNVGARWWEIYNNTFTPGPNNSYCINLRAGSGVVFGNTVSGGGSHCGMCEEDTGYPADYQIGRGLNQTSDPAYFGTGQTGLTLSPDAGDAAGSGVGAGMVTLGVDVISGTRPGYTAYTYPHPLNGGGGGGGSTGRPLQKKGMRGVGGFGN